MYDIYGIPGPSLLIESTDSMIWTNYCECAGAYLSYFLIARKPPLAVRFSMILV